MLYGFYEIDEHVIHINFNSPTNLRLEHLIDQSVIDDSDIFKTKGHHFIVVQPAVINKLRVLFRQEIDCNLNKRPRN